MTVEATEIAMPSPSDRFTELDTFLPMETKHLPDAIVRLSSVAVAGVCLMDAMILSEVANRGLFGDDISVLDKLLIVPPAAVGVLAFVVGTAIGMRGIIDPDLYHR